MKSELTQPETGTGAGLYIHVPFCTSVCPYCDFAVTIAGAERRQGWLEGVLREAALYSDLGLGFDTVYLGGGTPSALDSKQLAAILDGIRRRLAIDDGATLILEANPEDVSAASAAAWRDLGFEFVSLGVQSFDDADLAFLGRRHSAGDARCAIEALGKAHFATVSIDLIYGLEGRSPRHWRRQIESAIASQVDHLSCYQLTVHEETVLGRRVADGVVTEVDESVQAELFFMTHELLADAGFEAYEVSNFAAGPAHRSRHNQKYWDHTPYLGLGPSAHSFVGGRRWWNLRKLRLWQRAVDSGERPVEDTELPSPGQLALEALMLGFRTAAGVDLERLSDRFGVDLLAENAGIIDRLTASGHLVMDGPRLKPTLAGLAVADTLAREFVV